MISISSISKFPDPPDLTQEQIEAITEITFLNPDHFPQPNSFDLLFVFGGSHPALWETALQAYQQGKVKQILVTGGYKPTGIRHESWNYGTTPEARVFQMKLIEHGVKKDHIMVEDRSVNSLENVLFAKQIFDFSSIQTLLFASKAFASGRQYRTLKKHLPSQIQFTPLLVPSTLQKEVVSRENWMNHPVHRSAVYGEYLRIVKYGEKGDIEALETLVPGL